MDRKVTFAAGVASQHYDEIEQADDDFQEGYEAGYNARAERRTALGTPAYRLGYACGVQQRTSARLQRAQADRSLILRAFLIGLVLALLLGWVLVKSARADTLADWKLLNEVCQGGSGAVSDKACAARNPTAAKLRAEGWFQGNHGVWVSPEHMAIFTRIMRSYDAAAREQTSGALDKLMEGMMTELRAKVPPEAIFALWNARAGHLLTHTPYAAGMLLYGLPHLERLLSGRNDPRFRMVLKP